jgi:hypothetical protein
LCTSIMVFTSAIGPALFALGLDVFGSYRGAEMLCIAMLILLLLAAIRISQPQDRPSGK